jgi:FMN-dependent NADH-azoreductase
MPTPRAPRSEVEIADIVEQEWRTAHPHAQVVTRHIGVEPIPATAWATAVSATFVPEGQRSPEQIEALALAAEATDQLVDADALLFAVPLYNFGVSQHFKTWVDLVISDPRMGAGVEPVTTGKPAVLVTVRGGGYAPGTPREGWDHATAWMRRILADVWKLDLKVVESGAHPGRREPGIGPVQGPGRADPHRRRADRARARPQPGRCAHGLTHMHLST